MQTKEIPRNEWSAFFDSFSRQHEGWLVSLEICGPEIGAQIAERDLAFEGITDELNEVEGDTIMIMTGAATDDHVTHTISRPTQLRLEQTDEGADAVIGITSADGTTALLTLRSPMLPEWIDGVVTTPEHTLR